MNHDPLCPELWRWEDGQPCMFCALIARVREDMLRWPKVAEVYIKGRDAGYKRGYEDAVSQYKALFELHKSLFELPETKKTIIDSKEVKYRRV